MKIIDYIEVHWWIKDSTQRARIKGIDIIKEIHLKDLKLLVMIDTLHDFDESWALTCLHDLGSNGSGLTDEKEPLFKEFLGMLFDVTDEPTDFGINKIKKIYKKQHNI